MYKPLGGACSVLVIGCRIGRHFSMDEIDFAQLACRPEQGRHGEDQSMLAEESSSELSKIIIDPTSEATGSMYPTAVDRAAALFVDVCVGFDRLLLRNGELSF
jgi:hypothetical protein